MEVKKSSRANLEKDISLNYLMGIVIGLSVLFVGFEWGEEDIKITAGSGIAFVPEEEEIEATEQNEPPPPAVEPEIPKDMEIINIVEDHIVVEAFDFTSEDDATHAHVETYVAPTGVVEAEEEVDDNYIFQIVEKDPEFPGGTTALLKWIKDNMVYPTIAVENNIQGRVYCQFVVNSDGSVTDVEVTRGVNPYIDREAVRVLKLLPKFRPGEQRGKPVRVRYSIPVLFRLDQR